MADPMSDEDFEQLCRHVLYDYAAEEERGEDSESGRFIAEARRMRAALASSQDRIKTLEEMLRRVLDDKWSNALEDEARRALSPSPTPTEHTDDCDLVAGVENGGPYKCTCALSHDKDDGQ